MPIHSFAVLSPSVFVLTWKIEEHVDFLYNLLPQQCLDDLYLNNLSSPKRLKECIAVRVALYCLLHKLNFPNLALYKDKQGRPKLKNSPFHISFTHTTYLATAALSTTFPIGTDTEYIRPKLRNIQSKAFSEREIQDSQNCLNTLTIYWCAKEALYKLLKHQNIYAFKQIFIEPFLLQERGTILANLDQKQYLMHYQQILDSPNLIPHINVTCQDHNAW